MKEGDDAIEEKLQRIHRLSKIRWMVLGLSIVCLFLMAIISGAAGSAFEFVGVGGVLAFVVISLKFVLTECPRCRESACCKGFWMNPYATRCVHCGSSLTPKNRKREQVEDGDTLQRPC
jgi:hypothetical protein